MSFKYDIDKTKDESKVHEQDIDKVSDTIWRLNK